MSGDLIHSRHQSVISSMHEGFCVIKMLFDDRGRPNDYRFLEVNPAFERHTGLADAVGKRIRELAPDHEAHWFDIYGQVAVTGEPARCRHKATALGGRWFDVHAFRLDPAERRQVGVFLTDITQQMRTEEALGRSGDTFYHLIQNNPFGVYLVDADFKLREVSLGAQKVFATVHPLIGRDFAEVLRIIWAEPFATEAIGRFRHTLSIGEPYSAPSTIERRQDIEVVESYDWRIERVLLPDGRHGVVCYFYDLSERLQWEAALRESEEHLRLAIGIAQMGTFQIDLQTDAVVVNDPGREVYGWTRDEPLTFSKVQTHFHQDDTPHVLRRFEAALNPQGPGEFEVEQRIIRTDGALRWIKVRGRAQFDDVGGMKQAVRCLGTYLDITEQRQLQERIEQLLNAERAAREEAERASEAKSEFLAALSHELRTPLTPIMLTVSLMEVHPELPTDLREDVAMIRRNVELESRLISDLLDLTRIARGKLQLEMQDLDLHLIIRSAADICQREASAELTLDLVATRTMVHGDGTRLQQVFWNLINNAIKFTGPEGTITVRTRDMGDVIQVEVCDSGVGIDSAVIPKLFTAFEQGETRAARQHAGLGLGLAISKRLAEVHGGTITAFSEGRGRGATFTVTLPAKGAFPPPQPAAITAEPNTTHIPALNVLLVEDHDSSLKMMTRMLDSLGHRVTAVNSVASAIAAADRDAFDLLVSDLGLPDGSGLDIMRQLRDRYAGRAIALTGYGMEADIKASREAGFAEHLTKPIDRAALSAAIGRLVELGASTDS